MQFEDKDFPHQYGDKRPVPATSVSSPFAVPAPARPTEQHDREKLTAAAVNTSSSAGHRYTNHDRINTPQQEVTSTTDGNVPAVKAEQPLRLPSAAIDTGVNQPPLRRIKTESGALSMSTKQYFQRRERQRVERDAGKTELTADVKPAPNEASCKQQSTDLKTGSDHSVSSGQNISLKGQQENQPLPTSRGLGMGDASDQRPANIFESFRVNDSQQGDGSLESKTTTTAHMSGSQQADEVTAADNLDLGAILKPEHVHGGSYSLELPVFTTTVVAASSTAVTSVQSGNSSGVSVSHGHRGTLSTTVSSVPSDRSRQRVHAEHSPERRKSARREGSGVSLTSPTKHTQHTHRTDETSASDVSEMSRRSRASKSSQPSLLKVKLSLVSSAASHTDSPTVTKHAGETSTSTKLKSHVSSPSLESQTLSTSDSQEHIRLKLNVSSGRVEKVGNATASASPASGMKLVLSKDKVSGEYQHGTSGSESGHRHRHHHRHGHAHGHVHGHHHRRHKHSRPDSTHAAISHKRVADIDSAAKPSMEKKLRSELLGSGHESNAARRLSQPQPSQTNNVMISSGLSRTHIPCTYRVSGMLSGVLPPPPPPPPLPPLPDEEPAAPPPPPLPPQ